MTAVSQWWRERRWIVQTDPKHFVLTCWLVALGERNANETNFHPVTTTKTPIWLRKRIESRLWRSWKGKKNFISVIGRKDSRLRECLVPASFSSKLSGLARANVYFVKWNIDCWRRAVQFYKKRKIEFLEMMMIFLYYFILDEGLLVDYYFIYHKPTPTHTMAAKALWW